MSMHANRRIGAALVVPGMVLFLGLISAPEANSQVGIKLFTGGGYGLTPENAVQAAIEDAEASASAEGLYTCELVGEPSVFPRNDPNRGPSFSAEATLGCAP